MLATLSPKDQKFIKDSIKKYDDEVYKCMKTDISFKKDKGGRQEIVAFCKRRIVVFRENNNKIIAMSPYMSIQSVRAGENIEENITIESADPECSSIVIKVSSVEDQRDILVNIYIFFKSSFPDKDGKLRDDTKKRIFSEISQGLMATVEEYAYASTSVPQNGGFLDAYLGHCDSLRQDPLKDVVWDYKNLSLDRCFDTKIFYKYASEPERLLPLLLALGHNTYFTQLSLENFSIPREIAAGFLDMLRTNETLAVLNLSNCGLTREYFQQIMNALSENVSTKHFTELNFSNNPLEDKGLAALTEYISKCQGGLVTLDISNCRARKEAMYNFLAALNGNEELKKSLRALRIAENRCTVTETGKLIEFIRDSMLSEIDVSSTELDMGVLRNARSATLRIVNLAHNRVKNPSDICSFLGNMHIRELSLAYCEINSRTLAQMLDRKGSKLLSLTVLDLSNNPLGNRTLRTLNITGCFGRESEKRKGMIENLTKCINDSSVDELYMSAGSYPLRSELVSFLLAMIGNKTVKYLDISGHKLESDSGSYISQIIATNRTLVSLCIDRNMLILHNFIQIDNALKKNRVIQNIFMPIEDIAFDMKKNAKNTAYCDKLSKTMRSIQEKLNHNKSKPRSQDTLSSMIEDGDYDADGADDYYDGCGGGGGGGGAFGYGDPDAEVEVLVPIKGPMSKRISMIVTTPRSMIKSRAFGAPPTPGREAGGSTYVERSTDVADYGEFPEVKFLRPAGMDPEKTREFLMSIKDMVLDEEDEDEDEEDNEGMEKKGN